VAMIKGPFDFAQGLVCPPLRSPPALPGLWGGIVLVWM
jgi:hypothetical protein